MNIQSYFQVEHKNTFDTTKNFGNFGEIWALASIGNTKIITGSIDGTLRLYSINISTKQCESKSYIENSHGIGTAINYITVCDDQFFISCGDDGSIKTWSISDEHIIEGSQIRYHNKNVKKIILLNNKELLASCSLDKTIKIWEKKSPHNLVKDATLQEWNKVYSIIQLKVIRNPDDPQNILVDSWGTNCGFVTMWDLNTFKKIGTMKNIYTCCSNGLIELSNGMVAVSQYDPLEIVIFDPYAYIVVQHIKNDVIKGQSSLLELPGGLFVYINEGNYIQIKINDNYDIVKAYNETKKEIVNGQERKVKVLKDLKGSAGLILIENNKYILTNNDANGIGIFSF